MNAEKESKFHIKRHGIHNYRYKKQTEKKKKKRSQKSISKEKDEFKASI